MKNNSISLATLPVYFCNTNTPDLKGRAVQKEPATAFHFNKGMNENEISHFNDALNNRYKHDFNFKNNVISLGQYSKMG